MYSKLALIIDFLVGIIAGVILLSALSVWVTTQQRPRPTAITMLGN